MQKVSDDQRRDLHFTIRCNKAEAEAMESAAKEAGVPFSMWARTWLLTICAHKEWFEEQAQKARV